MGAENLIRYNISRSPYVVVASCPTKTSTILTETAIVGMTVRDRLDHTPSPTWRTFIRNQTPEVLSVEVYAELAGCVRAMSTWVIRARRRWLSWRGFGWRYRFGCRHPMFSTARNDPASAPVVWALGIADPVMASERSPPTSWWAPTDHPFHADPPIEMGRVDVRLDASVVTGWTVPPNLSRTPQTDNKEPRIDISWQAAA